MKTPKHHAEGKSVMVGRVEVARFTDDYQAQRFVKFIEGKEAREEEATSPRFTGG